MLPQAFIDSIDHLLKMDGRPDETAAFLAAQSQPSARGLRANRLRIQDRDALNRLLMQSLGLQAPLEPVAWTGDGLYYPPEASPAALVAYHAGLYYIQEPSAMLPAELLGARPGERILDLCAAPGGKSCRIAADLAGEGLLWANDISADRIRPLVRNLELMGCTNAIVSEETPERIAAVMPGWFDRILVDAPCSGAGMLRRDARALGGFGDSAPMAYVTEQAKILAAADRLLKPGGVLVYSTCTFAIEENEGQIADFLSRHPEYRQLLVALRPGLSEGLPIDDGPRIGIRVWPHRAHGDGHFCAVLIKGDAGITDSPILDGTIRMVAGLLGESPSGLQRFFQETLSEQGRARMADRLSAHLRLHEGHLHNLPLADIPANGLRLVKTGLYLGDLRQTSLPGRSTDPYPDQSRRQASSGIHRNDTTRFRQGSDPRRRGTSPDKPSPGDSDGLFTPSHALSHVLEPADLQHVVTYAMESMETRRYIRGETLIHPDLSAKPPSGAFVGIAADRYLIGFARQMPDGHLKNLYPPAWRKHS